jgi:hypothetical protein
MMHYVRFTVLVLLCNLAWPLFGQDDYHTVLTDRASKIVATLGLHDTALINTVTTTLVDQYKALGVVHDTHEAAMKQLNASTLKGPAKDSLNRQLEQVRDAALYPLHAAFVARLQALLTPEQVDAVKNGMTYNVLNVTYKAQLDMIPTLTGEEKQQIMIWLLEARELAMDASSSKAKHAWFGKYKGRINNYLSARGYDLKKEREAWNERLKATNVH